MRLLEDKRLTKKTIGRQKEEQRVNNDVRNNSSFEEKIANEPLHPRLFLQSSGNALFLPLENMLHTTRHTERRLHVAYMARTYRMRSRAPFQ